MSNRRKIKPLRPRKMRPPKPGKFALPKVGKAMVVQGTLRPTGGGPPRGWRP
jgi:hypothetical protein